MQAPHAKYFNDSYLKGTSIVEVEVCNVVVGLLVLGVAVFLFFFEVFVVVLIVVLVVVLIVVVLAVVEELVVLVDVLSNAISLTPAFSKSVCLKLSRFFCVICFSKISYSSKIITHLFVVICHRFCGCWFLFRW